MALPSRESIEAAIREEDFRRNNGIIEFIVGWGAIASPRDVYEQTSAREFMERVLSVLIEKAGGAVEITREELANARRTFTDQDIFRGSLRMAIAGSTPTVPSTPPPQAEGSPVRELLFDE